MQDECGVSGWYPGLHKHWPVRIFQLPEPVQWYKGVDWFSIKWDETNWDLSTHFPETYTTYNVFIQ